MEKMRRLGVLPIALVVLAACQGGAGTSPSTGDGGGAAACDGETDGHLARICEAGVLKVSTDPAYPPQSILNEATGEFEGFDIDVATAIAERLGVEVQFETPTFDAVVAGDWSGRWDLSVGSVTITESRKEVLEFTQPYYFTPAQMAVHADSDVTDLDGLAGATICVAEATTYLDWLEGSLTLPPEAGEVADPPEGATATTLPTDLDCAESWRSGRTDFEGWLSSITTVEGAIREDYPVVAVGDPVFFEPLAVAFDLTVEDDDSLIAAVDQILTDMHGDGTLAGFSETWFDGQDLTTDE